MHILELGKGNGMLGKLSHGMLVRSKAYQNVLLCTFIFFIKQVFVLTQNEGNVRVWNVISFQIAKIIMAITELYTLLINQYHESVIHLWLSL